MKINIIRYLSIILTIITIYSCEKQMVEEPKPEFIIEVEHLFGDKKLEIGKEYTNKSGESLSISTLMYQISNITLYGENGEKVVLPEEKNYYIIDESDPKSLKINISDFPEGNYKRIEFLIGVDSMRNVLGVQNAPTSLQKSIQSGMYWSWNTGYIFFKLEGTSEDSQDGEFMFHIGGFLAELNNIKKLATDNSFKPIQLSKGEKSEIKLKLDVAKVFDNLHIISLQKTSHIHYDPNSKMIAKNYETAFSLRNK